MKSHSLILALLTLVFLAGCGKQELPYDLEGVEKGVVINIHKPAGSPAAMNPDKSSVFDIILDIPSQQGDWSMLDKAYLTAVYTHEGNKTVIDMDNQSITQFPCTLQLNLSDVCTELGISGNLTVGDRLEFTPSYVLKSGTVVSGWNALSNSFNNTAFTGWMMEDGSSFSYRISYTAFAPFVKEHYLGTGVLNDGYDTPVTVTEIDELPDAEWIPTGVPTDKLIGLQVTGDIFFGGDVFKMWINTLDYTLIIPDQVIRKDFSYGSLGTYDATVTYCEGEIDTLNEKIIFYFYTLWGPYSFGDAEYEISF